MPELEAGPSGVRPPVAAAGRTRALSSPHTLTPSPRLRLRWAVQVCKPNTPLTFQNVTVFRGTPGKSTFDFNTFTGTNGATYTIGATNGVLTSTQPGGSVY
jgi:hypothetical protein